MARNLGFAVKTRVRRVKGVENLQETHGVWRFGPLQRSTLQVSGEIWEMEGGETLDLP